VQGNVYRMQDKSGAVYVYDSKCDVTCQVSSWRHSIIHICRRWIFRASGNARSVIKERSNASLY
jgi:hypothetical protein